MLSDSSRQHQDADQSSLGKILTEGRRRHGLSLRETAAASKVEYSLIDRMEHGHTRSPAPDKLVRIAAVLHIPLVDLFTAAGYQATDVLPGFATYLATRYPTLTRQQRHELSAHFAAITTES